MFNHIEDVIIRYYVSFTEIFSYEIKCLTFNGKNFMRTSLWIFLDLNMGFSFCLKLNWLYP